MRGIYTIYIHPKEVETAIVDVNVLANYPTVKGVVFDSSKLDGITDLTGYRIEYYTDEGITKIARLITSCNFCEPMAVSVNQNFPSAKAYNLVNNSNARYYSAQLPLRLQVLIVLTHYLLLEQLDRRFIW